MRERILSNVNEQIRSLSDGAKIHFEMASITEMDLLNKILEYVVPHTDSLGMNEQVIALNIWRSMES